MKIAEIVKIFGGSIGLRTAYILSGALGAVMESKKDDPDFSVTREMPQSERFKGGIFSYSGFPEFAELAGDSLKTKPRAKPQTKSLIPYWTLLADHKGMLAVLHEMFPQSPHIPPTYWGADALQGQKRVIKEALGCQGNNAVVFNENNEIVADRRSPGKPGKHYVTQAYCDAVYDAEGRYKVVNLFTADGIAAAIGTRVAPGTFVGGDGTQTRYVPVLVCG